MLISSNSLIMLPASLVKNACASERVNVPNKSNVAASAFSITKSFAASIKFPFFSTNSSDGNTMKLTSLVAVNPSAVVTVNVIGNTPPVSVTAFNAANCPSANVAPDTSAPLTNVSLLTINPCNLDVAIALSTV